MHPQRPWWRPRTAWTAALLLGVVAAGLSGSCGKNSFRQGEILYANFCSNCHMPDGSGLGGNIPALAGSQVLAKQPGAVACAVRYGLAASPAADGQAPGQPMPANPKLSDFEIANIINYINHSWGNDFGYVQIGEVRDALEKCLNEK
jgi:mono/diheme cytochrome c family protein